MFSSFQRTGGLQIQDVILVKDHCRRQRWQHRSKYPIQWTKGGSHPKNICTCIWMIICKYCSSPRRTAYEPVQTVSAIEGCLTCREPSYSKWLKHGIKRKIISCPSNNKDERTTEKTSLKLHFVKKHMFGLSFCFPFVIVFLSVVLSGLKLWFLSVTLKN